MSLADEPLRIYYRRNRYSSSSLNYYSDNFRHRWDRKTSFIKFGNLASERVTGQQDQPERRTRERTTGIYSPLEKLIQSVATIASARFILSVSVKNSKRASRKRTTSRRRIF